MSVDYNSALIYGWDCSRIQEDWPCEATEQMEELGFDVIRDSYYDEFLYIGKCISKTSCGEEARVDCLRYLDQTEIDVENMLLAVPEELKRNLPFEFPSLYHLCYAT
jgi:hypothetical protein